MKRVLIALLLCAGGLAQAQPMYWHPQRDNYRPLLQPPPPPRHMPPPHPGGQRWEDRQRLREEVRSGRMPREEAVRQYRERYGDPRHEGRHEYRTEPRYEEWRQRHEARRASPEQREQMRRDIMDADRSMGRGRYR
jgi:hypothetical protein